MRGDFKNSEVAKFIKEYKTQIIVIVVLVVVVVIWNKYSYKLMRLLKPNQQNNAPIPLSDVRKNQIETLMSKIHSDIHDTPFWGGHDYSLYDTLLGMYDDEIAYGADFYKNFLASGKSLYHDLDNEWFLWSDSNNILLAKLTELGKVK